MHAPQLPGLVAPEQGELPLRAQPAATEKQIGYARSIAARAGLALPDALMRDRAALAAWIDAHKGVQAGGRFASYPSAKQVAFAERIARIKRREIPRECFRDRTLMSRWIDGNKPH